MGIFEKQSWLEYNEAIIVIFGNEVKITKFLQYIIILTVLITIKDTEMAKYYGFGSRYYIWVYRRE